MRAWMNAYTWAIQCKRLGSCERLREMQWLMLQQDKPDDFIIATGRTETVRKFIELSATKIGWNNHENSIGIIWEGKGLNEIKEEQIQKK